MRQPRAGTPWGFWRIIITPALKGRLDPNIQMRMLRIDIPLKLATFGSNMEFRKRFILWEKFYFLCLTPFVTSRVALEALNRLT
jgi:hypothetical protein